MEKNQLTKIIERNWLENEGGCLEAMKWFYLFIDEEIKGKFFLKRVKIITKIA